MSGWISRLIHYLLLGLALTVCGSSFGKPNAGPAAPMFLGETKEFAVEAGGRPLAFWLDDKTLVFAGWPPADVSNSGAANIFMWKMGHAPQPYLARTWPVPAGELPLRYLCARAFPDLIESRGIPKSAGV